MFQNSHSYVKTRKLGNGQHGTVYLATPNKYPLGAQQHYAMKIVDRSSNPLGSEQQEILKSLRHPNVLRLYDSYEEGDSFVMILEYAEKGDLSRWVRPNQIIPQQQLANWIAQISLGLDYLHNQSGIIHRDIKLHNILVMQNGLLKLADFGIARRLDKGQFAKTSLGTPCYLSPQIVKGSNYDFKTDIWSFGCTLIELCCGSKPFKTESFKDLIDSILYQQNAEISSEYPRWIRDLVKSMLIKDDNKRPDIRKILSIKEIQDAVLRLKQQYPSEYKDIVTVEVPKTTKYFERQEPHFMIPLHIAESLKTAKRSQKSKMEAMKSVSKPKIEQKFYNRSLQFHVQQSKKDKTQI